MARIYWRSHGNGPPRAWGDFTSLGHGREPLVEPASLKRLGTTNPAIAAMVFADRVKELEQAKVDRAVLGVERRMTLGAFIPQHLALRRQEATVTETWLKETGARLQSGAIRFFGADCPVTPSFTQLGDTKIYAATTSGIRDSSGGSERGVAELGAP